MTLMAPTGTKSGRVKAGTVPETVGFREAVANNRILAQMVERMNENHEGEGSNPLYSTY